MGRFLFGGGATYSSNTTKTNGLDSVTISGPGGVVYSRSGEPTRTGEDNFEHLLAGYLHQFSRFVIGLEYSHTFGAHFNYHRGGFDPGTLSGNNFVSQPGAAQCGVYVPNHFTCVGGTLYGGFKAKDHFRAILGYEVAPSLLVFGAAGVMRGLGQYQAVSQSGMVINSPNTPLVGKSTVGTPASQKVRGTSFGGGAQFKVTDQFSLRIEYLRDTAKMNIRYGGTSFSGTIGNQTTNASISSGTKQTFINESWRAAVIYKY